MGNPMCNCNSAHSEEVSFTGVSCEQKSTSHCTPGLDQDQKDSFRTNHGRCIDASIGYPAMSANIIPSLILVMSASNPSPGFQGLSIWTLFWL